MKKLVLFLVLLCASCAPAQPAAVPTDVVVAPPTAVQEVSVVKEPMTQEVPVTWEYKTLIMSARVSGPVGEKLTGEDCMDAAATPGAGSLCIAEDANTAILGKLNTLGTERWELVGIVYAPDTDAAVYFFKRPVLAP